MLYIIISLLSFSTIKYLNYLYKKNSVITEKLSDELRKIHKVSVIRIGSITFFPILLTLYYISDFYLTLVICFSFIFLTIGLYEDISNSLNKYFRLILLFIVVLLFQQSTEIIVLDFNNNLLNFLINKDLIISSIFVIFSMVKFLQETVDHIF